LVAVLAVIIILLSCACGFLFYQKQVAEQEAERMGKIASVYQTKIVDVSIVSAGIIGSLDEAAKLNVTVQNFGKYDVEDLNMSVRHASGTGQTEWAQIELVNGVEMRHVIISVRYMFSSTPSGFVVTLMWGDIILDKLDTSKN
jgi:hypothetical protein